jgi:hypothetical protein
MYIYLKVVYLRLIAKPVYEELASETELYVLARPRTSTACMGKSAVRIIKCLQSEIIAN